MFTFTSEAIEAIQSFQKDETTPSYVRYRIANVCCNQMQYDLAMTASAMPQEKIINFNGVDVLYHPADLKYLEGTEIDYKDDGFFIRSPHPLMATF
ncbi:hypothetical protein HRF87_03205 [Bacillus sp. CRN 9]|nr:hypothetical protein [Bacillus sp. CRN 9]